MPRSVENQISPLITHGHRKSFDLCSHLFPVKIKRNCLPNIGLLFIEVPRKYFSRPMLITIYSSNIISALESQCFVFADDTELLPKPDTDPILRNLDKVHKQSIHWHLPLNLGKCQGFIKIEANLYDHMGPPGH